MVGVGSVVVVRAALQHLVLHAVVGQVAEHAELVADFLPGQLLVLLVDFPDYGLPLLFGLLGSDADAGLLEPSGLVLLPAQAVG